MKQVVTTTGMIISSYFCKAIRNLVALVTGFKVVAHGDELVVVDNFKESQVADPSKEKRYNVTVGYTVVDISGPGNEAEQVDEGSFTAGPLNIKDVNKILKDLNRLEERFT